MIGVINAVRSTVLCHWAQFGYEYSRFLILELNSNIQKSIGICEELLVTV